MTICYLTERLYQHLRHLFAPVSGIVKTSANEVIVMLPRGHVHFEIETDRSCVVSCGRFQVHVDLSHGMSAYSHMRTILQHHLLLFPNENSH